MNEIKGTRMPDYSGVSKDRDMVSLVGFQTSTLNVLRIIMPDIPETENTLTDQ